MTLSSSIPTPENPDIPPTNQPTKPKLESKSVSRSGRSLKHVSSEESDIDIPKPPPLPPASSSPPIHQRGTPTPEQHAKQQQAIQKLKYKIKHAPKTATNERGVQIASEQLYLKKIAKQIQKSKTSPTPPYNLPTMGHSQNPVGQLGGTLFVPKNVLEKNLSPSRYLPVKALTLQGLTTYYAKEEVLDKLRFMLMTTAKDAEDPALLEIMAKVKAMPDSYLSESLIAPDLDRLCLLKKLTPLISAHDFITANSNSFGAAEIAIKKAAKISQIAAPLFVFKTGPENVREQLAGKLLTSLGLAKPLAPKLDLSLPGAKLRNQENPTGIASSFIEGTTLMSIQAWHTFQKENRKHAENQFFKQYYEKIYEKTVSTFEVQLPQMNLEIAQMNQRLADAAKQSANIDKQKEKITLNLQNIDQEIGAIHKEISAFPEGERLHELNGLLDTKTRLRAENTQKMEQLNKQHNEFWYDTRNIQDQIKILENTIIDHKAKLDKSKAELIRLDQPLDAWNQAKNALLSMGGEKDIQTHVLTNLIFGSCDSHEEQYIVSETGRIINIDFARFLAPGTFGKVPGGHAALFCSALLAHPYAQTPLSADLEHQIMNWNIKEIEAQWQDGGLIGDRNEYAEAGKMLQFFKTEIERLEHCPPIHLSKLLKEHEVGFGVKQTKNDETTKAEILQMLKDSYAVIQERCFSKIHPAAFEAFKQRVSALQKYIRDCHAEGENATLEAAFPVLYPELAPFMAVAAREYTNPANDIGITTLEEFIKRVQKDNLATADEMREMQLVMKNIKDKAIEDGDLYTTINSFDLPA